MGTSDEVGDAERRKHARVPGPFDGWRISVIPIPVQIYDLSQGGCFVNSLHEQKQGIPIVLEIDLPGEGRVKVKGETLYSKPGFGYAVRFVEMTEEASIRVERALQQVRE